MKLHYLGTAAAEGIPAIFCQCDTCRRARQLGGRNIRTRSQALVDDRLLLDFCPDTNLHALRYGLELGGIHSCFITHIHSDHLIPRELFNRRVSFAYLDDEDTPLTIYGSAEVGQKLEADADGKVIPDGRVLFQPVEAFRPLTVEGYEIIPLKAAHGTEMPLIYAIGKDGKWLLYAHDTDRFDEATWTYLKESGICFDFVSLDCTAGKISIDYFGHMNIPRAKQVRARMLEEGLADANTRFCINHFSHNGQLTYDDTVDPAVCDGFEVSYDGMVVEI